MPMRKSKGRNNAYVIEALKTCISFANMVISLVKLLRDIKADADKNKSNHPG